MYEMEIPEEVNNPEKPSGRLFSEKWRAAWKQLEERARQRPGPYLILALAIGYVLQIIPFRSLLVLAVKVCLILVRPVLFLVCAFLLVKNVSKGSNFGSVSE
jgi:hypothetical protein